MSEVVVVGSGFAGLWAALGAARRLDELAVPAGTINVTVLSAKPFHDIRVRNYEANLSASRVPLADVLDPVGVSHITAKVTAIDSGTRTVTTVGGDGQTGTHGYDRLVLAAGSQVFKPNIPGLREFGFDVDTYDNAIALTRHLARLSDGPVTPELATVVVVGAGLTGIEAASELPGRLAAVFAGHDIAPRVVLIDHSPKPEPQRRVSVHADRRAARWLFPGLVPGQPIANHALTTRLARHDINVRIARNGALAALAADLPAAVLADLLGMHINTAVRWVKYVGRDWADYIAARAIEHG